MLIDWDDPDDRTFEHGLDRGVLYMSGKDPIPWNGLMSVDEGGSGAATLYYRDGIIYLADADAGDFEAKMTTIHFPRDFGECLGYPEVTDGLFADNQKPKRFGLSYRTLVGSGSRGDMFGYQIHLVYNAMAVIASRSRKTIGSGVSPVEFNFDLVCTPVKLAGFRPTAHFVIDTRNMSESVLEELEDLLYGTGETPGVLPPPEVLYDIMNFGDSMVFRVHTDGTYTVTGSSTNLIDLGGGKFRMKNINAVDIGSGKYTVSDGGNTDVIIE